MELVRELDGEKAYEKMIRAVERASQTAAALAGFVARRSGAGTLDRAANSWEIMHYRGSDPS